jgi:hypothetical protein
VKSASKSGNIGEITTIHFFRNTSEVSGYGKAEQTTNNAEQNNDQVV